VASADLKGDLQVEASALAVLPLPRFFRDPIDRLLVAQAQLEGLRFPNADDNLVAY
jgi:PIN domain nuclease of toxin-antitoxin system